MPVLKVKQDGVWKEIITGASFGSNIELDQTLAVEGMAADAKAVGDAIVRLSDEGSKHLTVDIDDISESEPNPVNADSLGGIIADEYASKTFVRTKIAEAIEEAIVEVYVQDNIPEDAPDGSIWVNLDADGAPTTSGKTTAKVYVVDAGTTDMTTIDFSQYAIGDVVVVTSS